MLCFDSYVAVSVGTARLRVMLQVCQGYSVILLNCKFLHCVDWLCQALFSAAVNGNCRDTMPSNWPSCATVLGRKPSSKWPVTHDWTQWTGQLGTADGYIIFLWGLESMIVIISGSVTVTIVGWEQIIRRCISDIAEAWICNNLNNGPMEMEILAVCQRVNTSYDKELCQFRDGRA